MKEDELIRQIARLSSNELFDIVENFSKETKIKKLPLSDSETRNINTSLVESYKLGKLVLVLGAGVSMSHGLPNWNILLQKLLVKTIDKGQKQADILAMVFSNMFNQSPLIAGKYLEQYFEENTSTSFEKEVRKALYEDIKPDHCSTLIDAIVSFCIAPGKSPNLDSIITYNFDDILEERLSNLGFEVPYKCVFGNAMTPQKNELPIYHVHGFLPRVGDLCEQHKITLGENIYHDQYIDTYSWNNIVQINKFRENSCLFIGTSLTDPNTRRLLDIARKHSGQNTNNHFIIKIRLKKEELHSQLKELTKKEELISNGGVKMNVENTANLLLEIRKNFEEQDALSFGVNTIWVDSFDEIPQILKQLKKGTSHNKV